MHPVFFSWPTTGPEGFVAAKPRHGQRAVPPDAHVSADRNQPPSTIVLKTKPVWWFDQKKPEPKPSPVF
jgi:hypothetical protein